MRDVDAAPPLDFIESDGKPMGETGFHAIEGHYLVEVLTAQAVERGWTGAYVGSNQFFYWDPTDSRKCVVPDVYLFRELQEPERVRSSFRLWTEGRHPDLIFEIASRGTWEEDLGRKKDVYRDVFRTSEYVVFDPLESILGDQGPLIAYRLGARGYRRVGDETGFESRVLGASFRVIDKRLRLLDAGGRIVPGDPRDLATARATSRREGREEGRHEGREEGLHEGLHEGRQSVLRQAVVQMLELRFGALPDDVRRRLDTLSGDALERAFSLAATIPSPEALLE